jgi:hypothetical protein
VRYHLFFFCFVVSCCNCFFLVNDCHTNHALTVTSHNTRYTIGGDRS